MSFGYEGLPIMDHAIYRFRDRVMPDATFAEARHVLVPAVKEHEADMVTEPPEYVENWHGTTIGWIPLDDRSAAVVRPHVKSRKPCVVTVVVDDRPTGFAGQLAENPMFRVRED